MAIRDQVAPPTINLDNPSVETVLDLVPHKARPMEINVALSNSFGFGGTNATLVFQRYNKDAQVRFKANPDYFRGKPPAEALILAIDRDGLIKA